MIFAAASTYCASLKRTPDAPSGIERLLDARAGIVEEGEERVVALPLDRRAIGLRQNGLHLLGLQIARRMDRRFLHGHVQNLSALLDSRRFAVSNEAEEATQCGQATVARANRISAFLLGVLQEGLDLGGRQVAQCELGYRPASALSHEPEEPGAREGLRPLVE